MMLTQENTLNNTASIYINAVTDMSVEQDGDVSF